MVCLSTPPVSALSAPLPFWTSKPGNLGHKPGYAQWHARFPSLGIPAGHHLEVFVKLSPWGLHWKTN